MNQQDELREGIRALNLTDVPYERETKLRSYLTGFLKDRMTRRQLLRVGSLSGLSISALWALACQPAAPAAAPTKAPVAAASPTPAPPTQTPKPKRPQIIKAPWTSEPKHLDAIAIDSWAWGLNRNMNECLIRMEAYGPKIVPDMAKEWTVSPDGLTYTFKLRPDRGWNQGFGKVTAQDVKAHFERCQDPKEKSIWAPQADAIAGMETPDELTFVMKMKKPRFAWPYFLVNKLGWISSKRGVDKLGVEAHGRKPVVSGPFEVLEWQPRQFLRFKRRDDYVPGGKPKPKVEEVKRPIHSELAAQQLAFQAGEYDFVNLETGDEFMRYSKDPKFVAYKIRVTATMTLFLNHKIPPLDNLNVRKALFMLTNKKDFVKAMFDLVEEAVSVVAPDIWGHDPNTPVIPYDPKAGIELIKKEGFDPAKLDILISTEEGFLRRTELTVGMWQTAGLKAVRLENMDNVSLKAKQRAGATQVLMDQWQRPPDIDLALVDKFDTSMFPPGKSTWYGHQELLDKIYVEMDPKKRQEYASQLQKWLNYDSAQVIPLHYGIYFRALQKYLRGYGLNPEHGEPWEEMWLED